MEKKNQTNNKNDSPNQSRLKEIIKILSKHKVVEGINPKKFKEILEDLGATYIKIGQIMSMRTDILPEEYCKELSTLRKETNVLPFKTIKQILKKEFKKPLNDIFLNIDEIPLGSASIAQVHKATLKTGEKVVIKVQKPYIYETMAQDMKLLQKAFSLLKVPFVEDVIDIKGILDEMWTVAKQELDFLIEASHINEFSVYNKDLVYLKSPKVYTNLSTTNILVMEYIDGIIINDVTKLEEKGYDLKEISLKLANSYISQIVDYGFFHADPHPDNLKIQEGKIVFLDYGMMGRLSKRDREIIKECMNAIINKDVHKVEKCILNILITNEKIDHPSFINDLELFLDKYSTLELKNVNLGLVLNDLFKLTKKHKIKIPKNITMLSRGVLIIEGVLNELCPDINLMAVLKGRLSSNFFKEILDKENIANNIKDLLLTSQSIVELPKETLDLVKMISRGNAKLNLELSDSDNKIGKVEKMLNKVILAALDVAFIVACSLLYTNNTTSFEISILKLFSLISAVFITLFLVILMINDLRSKHK